MTASPSRRDDRIGRSGRKARPGGRPERALVAILPFVLALGLAACATPSVRPSDSPIEPLPTVGAMMPDDEDLAASDLAAAVLADDRAGALEALDRIDRIEAERPRSEQGLGAYARNAVLATLDDPVAYREAVAELLDRSHLDPGLRARLEQERDDDPLRLADRRIRDSLVRRFGRIFNAFSAPVGKSLMTGTLAFAGLARGALSALLTEMAREPIDTTERQALIHWKSFLEAHPDSERAGDLVDRVEDAQGRWYRMQRERSLKLARRALEHDSPRVAYLMTERALHYAPEHPTALRLREQALGDIDRWRTDRDVTLEASNPRWGTAADPESIRPLLLALLARPENLEAEAGRLLRADPDGPLADEARFALATAMHERGAEAEMWRELEALASDGTTPDHNMARHARALYESPVHNPYRVFRSERSKDSRDQALWILFGPFAGGPRDRDLPPPLEWMIDAPMMAQMLMSMPNRLVRYPWLKPWPFGRKPAVLARRYLERFEDGEHRDELAGWLEDYERRRGNWVGALEAARMVSDRSETELAELRERAAKQKLEAAQREKQSDLRLSLLQRVARDDPGTPAGHRAGLLAREQAQHATPQEIRLSRGFLEDHPHIAGPDGLGLAPELLDGKERNGELHPNGVTLVGARTLRFDYLAASGKAGDPPETEYRQVSAERLARLVALVDETSLRLATLDSDYEHESDADRDLYFERARLGLSDRPDRRPTARSSYAFEGMREKYGLVRSRESILPFEIVVQGSLYDFGFGVFPRIRMPKPTPDAILYR